MGRLGGILRLADALDSCRSALIKDVSCLSGGTTITIHLTATEENLVEISGANAKKDLFKKALGRTVVFATS